MISNWLAFAALVYGLGVGAHWWPGPVAAYRDWRARRALRTGADAEGEYLDEDAQDYDPDDLQDESAPDDAQDESDPDDEGGAAVPMARRGVTGRDGHRRDTRRDTTRDTTRDMDTGGETPQDTTRDTGHRNPSPRVWTRVRQAVDLVRGIEPDTDSCLSTVPAPTPPHKRPAEVTDREHIPGEIPASPGGVPPRVVVHYVEPGSWTGQVAGTGEDGHPVVIRYMPRSSLAAPTDLLTRPTPEPAPTVRVGAGEPVRGDALPIDEITVRREWLRTMTNSGRFTPDEIRDLYVAKWDKSAKTLARDLDAIAIDDTPGEQTRR